MRVWESYRTSRTFGYGYESVTELPEVPGIVTRGVQTSQKFRVRVCMSYRTNRSSGSGMKVLTELQEVPGIVARANRTYRVPGTGMNVLQNLQKFRLRVLPG